MDYRIVESYYGPGIRFSDWRPEDGNAESAGGLLHLLGRERASVIRSDYLYGGGGDVELALACDFDRLGEQGCFTAHFNESPKHESRGFRFVLNRGRMAVYLRGEQIAEARAAECDPGCVHQLRLATVAESYAVYCNGECLAEGEMAPPFIDNEGRVKLIAHDADVRLLSFEESFIAHPIAVPPWRRGELLYEESFSEESLRDRWVCDCSTPETGPTVVDGGYVFRHMCNCVLKQRYEGPLAVDYVATPVPTDRFSAGITDAIFIWMLDKPEGDLIPYLNAKSEAGQAGLDVLLPLSLYWVDFGGSNNVTTRLRKNPGRHLIRQFTDSPRLLERNRTYHITAVQNGHFVEFWGDGEPMIQFYDPHPLTTGHVGVRAYCADLALKELKVWRIS